MPERAHTAPGVTQRWPQRSYLELGALPGAVTCARLHSRLVLIECGLGALAETVELIVSELITKPSSRPRD